MWVPFAVLLVLVLVTLAGGMWLGAHPTHLPGFVRDAVGASGDTQLVDETLDAIKSDYYRKIDRTTLVNRGLEGAVRSLHDPFSDYYDPKAYQNFSAETSGRFAGVGIISKPDKRGLRVVRVLPGTPAARAGLRRDDVINGVDGHSIAGNPASTSLIRGDPGTRVTLLVLRAGGKRRFRLTRTPLHEENVHSRMLRAGGEKIAYVQLTQFSPGAHAEVGAALRRLLDRGAHGIVFDLRGNGGGQLDEAQLVGSLFIAKGTIVSVAGRSRPKRVLSAEGGVIAAKQPLVVLMDHDTASASEIVAGAIQDRGRGKLVGTNSYGKGVFQEVKNLSNGGALKITVGEYFLPSGRNLGGGGVKEGRGLVPDVRVRDDRRTRRDEVLRAALRILADSR